MVDVPIKLTVQGSEQSGAAVDKLRQKFDTLNKELSQNTFKRSLDTAPVDNLTRRFGQLTDEIGVTRQLAVKLNDELQKDKFDNYKALGIDLDEIDQKAQQAAASLSNLNEKAGQSPTVSPVSIATPGSPRAATTRAFDAAQSAGDASTGFSAAGSAIRGLGAGAIGGKIADFGDLLGFVEQAPRLGEGLKAMLVSAGPLVGVTLAVAGGAALMSKALKDSAKEVKVFADEAQKKAEAERRTNQDLRNLTLEGAKQQLEDLKLNIATEIEARNRFTEQAAANLAQVDSFSDAATTAFSGLAASAGVMTGNVGATITSIEDSNKKIVDWQAEIDRLNNDVVKQLELQAQLQAAQERGAREGNAFAQAQADRVALTTETENQIKTMSSEAAKERLAELETLRAAQQTSLDAYFAELERLEQLKDSLVQSGASDAKIAEIDEQFFATQDAMNLVGDAFEQTAAEIERTEKVLIPNIATRERETAALESNKRALEQAAGLRERLNSLTLEENDLQRQEDRRLALKEEAEGLQTLRKAEDDAINSREKAALALQKDKQNAAKLVSIQNEADNNRATIDAKYMDGQLKKLAEFRQKEARIVEDSNNKRLDLISKLEEDLLEAVANNDVSSFIGRQRQGRNELGRFDRDTSLDSRRRFEDFDGQAQEAESARAKELDQLQQHTAQKLEVERQGQVQTISIAEQFNAERAALAAKRVAEDALRQETLQQKAVSDRLARLNKEQELVNQQLINLDKQAVANAAIIGANAVNSLLSGASQAVQRGIALFGGQSSAPTQAAARSVIPPSAKAANAGLPDRPTFAMLGEKPGWGDVTFPFNKSEGIERSLNRYLGGRGGGEPAMNFYFNNNTFSRPEDLQEAKQEVMGWVIEASRQRISLGRGAT